MFVNYQQTSTPDNRFAFLTDVTLDPIVLGASVTHIFTLPFIWTNVVAEGKIFYTQGDKTVISKTITEAMLSVGSENTILSVALTPADTKIFKRIYQDTQCQIKIITKDGKTIYDSPKKIKVIAPIVPPPAIRK